MTSRRTTSTRSRAQISRAAWPRRGRYDLEVFRLEPSLQQPDIGENVVDNEDPGRHIKLSTPQNTLRRYASPMKRRTVSRNTATDIGFDT